MTISQIQNSQRVLIIEDHAGVAHDIKNVVERYGVRVQRAEDAGEALNKVESWQPTLIVLDLMLPYGEALECLNGAEDPTMNSTGIRFLSELRRREHLAKKPPVSVIIMTALPNPLPMTHAWELVGKNGWFFFKPFKSTFFEAKFCHLLDLKCKLAPAAAQKYLDALEAIKDSQVEWRHV